MPVSIRPPGNAGELEQCAELRYMILREPLGLPRAKDRAKPHGRAFIVAAFDGGRVVGTGRLQKIGKETAKVCGLAVERGFTGIGIGSGMLRALEKKARAWDVKKLRLIAREDSVGFYEKNGYSVLGGYKTLAGRIRRFRMEKALRSSKRQQVVVTI